ncbi:MAG TPA: hypothetical protein VHO24_10330 [Opitutaceae bacterium]|nr:hypothetical protein [Opitutaceae bacterium]
MSRSKTPLTPRAFFSGALFVAGLWFPLHPAGAANPDYKLGDVATEDVITPVPLVVPNPEATEALKKKMASQINFVVRITPQSAEDAEAELRAAIVTARTNFLSRFQFVLEGRAPAASDLASPLFNAVVNNVAVELPKDLPLAQLAPLWVRGESDAALVESLLKPLREAMSQPIVARTDGSFPTGQTLRFVAVKNASDVPPIQELEAPPPAGPARKVIALWRARRLVETGFPTGQENLGRFVSSFVRANAYPDPASTEMLRARRIEGVTANDTYEAAQVIVRKGQPIDRRAMTALAAMREKSLIGTLQNKLDQEQAETVQIKQQTYWIAGGLGILCGTLLVTLWRLRSRHSTELMLLTGERAALPAGSPAEFVWQQRALLAEAKAERAHEAIRSGALGWMKEKIFGTLSRHRTELLSAQQKAELEMRELEQRLERMHTPLQDRISAYEKRIEELEKDLAAKGEENRQLIGARISVAKQQLVIERKRGGFGTN